MKRYLCCLAVLGVVAVPDWASAFHPCWAPPPPCQPAGYGIYGPPPPAYPHQLVFIPPYAPAYEVPLPPPRVYPSTPAATVPRPAAPTPNPGTAKTTPTGPAAPVTTQPPATTDSGVRPAGANTPPPPPKPEMPPPANPEPLKPPALVLPTIPGVTDTKPTGPSIPSAVPSPAPPPAAPDFAPAIPPVAPKLPLPSDPKKPDGLGDTLPPLTLPPESSAAPSGVVPSAGPSISRSSPLTGGVKVQVFTAAGAPPLAATRKVGFYNHTGKDIDLVIEGRAVTLPRKSYIHAEVSPVFNWKRGDHAAETATVPDGAAGLDVLFRE